MVERRLEMKVNWNWSREFAKHDKHLDECGWCAECVMTRLQLSEVTQLLKELFGAKPFLVTVNNLLEVLSGEVCPECLVDQIQKLNGGTK